MKVLIVDDEPAARQKIRRFLEQEQPLPTIREAEDGLQALQAIAEFTPDLVFLDIQMPRLDGIGLLERLDPTNTPAIIFTTAFDHYAVAAFDRQAIDYLLKPFDRQRFQRAWQRALARHGTPHPIDTQKLLALLSQTSAPATQATRFLVKQGERYRFVAVADLEFLQAEEKYVRLHTAKEPFLLRASLTHLESQLPPQHFVRIHRSYIVRLEAILEIQPWAHGDYVVIMRGGQRLPLSRRYSKHLLGGNAPDDATE